MAVGSRAAVSRRTRWVTWFFSFSDHELNKHEIRVFVLVTRMENWSDMYCYKLNTIALDRQKFSLTINLHPTHQLVMILVNNNSSSILSKFVRNRIDFGIESNAAILVQQTKSHPWMVRNHFSNFIFIHNFICFIWRTSKKSVLFTQNGIMFNEIAESDSARFFVKINQIDWSSSHAFLCSFLCTWECNVIRLKQNESNGKRI